MSQQGPQDQPSEEELRAYLEQLREAEPAQIVVQAYQVLGTGAEVKLGRPDARMLIDTMAALADTAEGHLPQELTTQMREGVRQLQLAQVQAETEGGAPGQEAGATGGAPGGQQEAASAAGSPGQPPQQPPAPQPGDQSGKKATDRLWIPGREPGI